MKVGNYTILKNLNGNRKRRFSNSFLVQNELDQNLYVLKIANGEQIPYLVREANFYFEHRQLPKIIQLEQNKNQAVLILEYKKGVPVLEHSKNLNRKQRIQLIIQLLEQIPPLLSELNNNGIVHLDIKPSNLIFDNTEECLHLIDFGMAQKLPITESKLIFPLGYAAPEMILNKQEAIGMGTDLFALGSTIYHLWTGTIPHTHHNPSVMTNLQLAHPVERPAKCPIILYKVIAGLMDKPKWKTAPNRMNQNEVIQLLNESVKKREAFVDLSLPNLIAELKQYNEQSLLVKLLSIANIKVK